MAEQADIILNWHGDSPLFQQALKKLTRPYRYTGMPVGPGHGSEEQFKKYGINFVRAICQEKFPGVRPLRIALIGFSAGNGGPMNGLRSRNAKFIDAILSIDGLFAQYWPNQKNLLNTAFLTPWKAFAKLAVSDGRLCIITASSIKEPGTPSVAECAEWVWQDTIGSPYAEEQPIPSKIWGDPMQPMFVNPKGCIGGQDGQAKHCFERTEYPVYPVINYRKAGGFVVVNYVNLDRTGIGDHRLQAARVLPLMVEEFLVPRWNTQPPEQGIILA